jgi:hypothetical protein
MAPNKVVEYQKLDNPVVLVEDAVPFCQTKASSSAPKNRSPRRRCCLKWCLIVTGLLLLFVLAMAAAGYCFLQKQVKRFTTTERSVLPTVDIPKADLVVARDRAVLFWDTLQAGKIPEHDLEVTADELNGLIGQSDYLRGNAFVTVHNDKIILDLSLPTKGLPGGRGRYFGATGLVEKKNPSTASTMTDVWVSLKNPYEIEGLKGPIMNVDFGVEATNHDPVKVTVNGGEIFDQDTRNFVDPQDNLLDYLDCPEAEAARQALQRLADISVQEGKIVFMAKRNVAAAVATEEEVPVPPPSPPKSNIRGGGSHRHLSAMTAARIVGAII